MISNISDTKVIIIAAGLGSRLKSYTEEKPKCMLEFGGKTLLQRQLEVYRACGITEINLVRGYLKEKINIPDIQYFDNLEYRDNNILNSLLFAEPALNGTVIVSYSDILFEKHVVDRLMQSEHDISIVVDIDWMALYEDRESHPLSEAEMVVFDADNRVQRIGKFAAAKTEVSGEFIGMFKLSPRGADVFKRHFHRAKSLFWGKSYQRAATFQKAYITDIIQDMVDMGVSVHCVIIERGWREIDTVEDYEKALKVFAD